MDAAERNEILNRYRDQIFMIAVRDSTDIAERLCQDHIRMQLGKQVAIEAIEAEAIAKLAADRAIDRLGA